MELTAGIRRAVRLRPDAPALIDGDERWTWRQLADRVARLAAGLRAAGIGPGDRVAMLADNNARHVESILATLWAGGVLVSLNTRWAAAEIRDCLDDCGARLLLADDGHLARAGEAADGMRDPVQVVRTGRDGAGTAQWITDCAPCADARRSGSDLAALFYTGGTTGRSKGVMLSHTNLMANSLTALANMGIRESTVHLHVSPLFHVAGGARIFSVTLAGGAHVMLPKFDEHALLDTIARERVTLTIIVPTMLRRLLDVPDLEQRDLSSLELLTYGASPMPEALLAEAMRRLPGVRFLQSYGMTELSPVATVLGPDQHTAEGLASGRLRSAGRAVVNAEVRIVDEHGHELPTGAVGEVVVRGPMVMQGYWNRPDLTAEAVRDGWMHTGDAGRLDADGYLYLVDRIKDMIVSGGENVYSAEVENALHAHPAVRECAVIGVPDARWGERVHAVVVVHAGAEADEATLAAHCRARIAAFKVPRSWQFWPGELPRSGANKILKTALREPFWKDHDRRIN